jgi:ABC-type sugar transport system ATPase subunit
VLPLRASPLDFESVQGRPIKLGVRAEAVELVASGDSAGVVARVTQTELSGPDLMIYAAPAPGIEFCCRAPAQSPVARDDTVRIALVPERLHVFDPATERAIALSMRAKTVMPAGEHA